MSLSQSSDEAGASAVTDEVSGKILVDGTELGDVAAATGIPYSIGMESYRLTGEDIAPEFSNGIIQDLTYVMILQEYDHPVPIPEPDDYDVSEFACCCTNPVCKHPKEEYRMWGPQDMITYGKLPNGKYMINWPLEGNDFYCNAIEMTPEQRDSAFREAKERSIRFLYFMQNELGMKNLGIAEEYPTADGLPFYPYHRESRRIDGQVRFDLNDLMAPYDQPDRLYRTAIAVGDYPVDHHHTRYSGWESLPNLYFHPVPSYGLPIGVMMPRMYDDMLVIEKSISVTNIVNGSTRLQPVVLQLGQAAVLGQFGKDVVEPLGERGKQCHSAWIFKKGRGNTYENMSDAVSGRIIHQTFSEHGRDVEIFTGLETGGRRKRLEERCAGRGEDSRPGELSGFLHG